MKSSGKRSAPPPGPSPWMVYYHGKSYEDQTFCCNISGPQPVKTYRKKIPALHDKKILSCSHGWLVMYDYKNSRMCLSNSSTFETIYLPSLSCLNFSSLFDHGYILSSSPNNPDCKVLVFLKNKPSIMSCGVRDEEWSEIGYREQLKAVDPRKEGVNPKVLFLGEQFMTIEEVATEGILFFCNPVICGGKIYANLTVGEVITYPELWSIEIVEKPVLSVVLSKINSIPSWNHNTHSCCVKQYVVESEGELFSLMFRWRTDGIRRDPSLYTYDIEDESVLVELPRRSLPTPWRSPIWIMPEVVIRPPKECCNNSNEGQNAKISLDLKDGCKEDSWKNRSSTTEEKQLFNLPFDFLLHFLEEVTKRLLPLDYIIFRALSRICRSVAPSINWRIRLSGSETNLSFPLLMFRHNGQRLYNFMDPRVNYSYFMKIPEILEDTMVCYSNHGWLLMSRKDVVHLYNPFSRDIVSYTSLFRQDQNFIFAPDQNLFFASKPSRSECFLVSISFHWGTSVIINIRRPGRNEWINQKIQNKVYFQTYNSPVFFQDAFYYLDQISGYLGKFKLEEEGFTWQVFDKIRIPCCSFHRNFLVECGGELLSVFVERAGKWVNVYKLNQSNRAWEVVTNLSNYTLYLSRCSSFSVVASPGAGNRIYFPMRSCGIVFYSLDTRKWHFFGSVDSSDFYGTRWLLNSCWIEPCW
ncbi:hypothetical protein BUALT_Bualt12G0049100 [Buddleja alternifolia]|uniref:KIB1-4 beta-propeller domain-containing protein n=1 Tax=Buddleja alternifolia TaxID=168488 RepID=A0AAV6WX78_9LAMI|nr:hypothetical protein BUALT_Bualt12G0049100 [Buddleja alternifolia]